MNTKELIKRISEGIEITQKESRALLKQSIKVFTDNLERGTGFSIPELGTFSRHIRDRRKSYMPFNDRYAILPKKRVVHFQPSVVLKEDVKDLEGEDNA